MIKNLLQSTAYTPSDIVRMLIMVLLYILLIKLNLEYIQPNQEASVIWLPSGLSLALLLICGKRYWPAVFIGIVSGCMLILDRSWFQSATVGLFSNTLEPLLCLYLLSVIQLYGRKFSTALNEASDFLILSLAAVLSSFAAAIIGCTLLNLLGVYDTSKTMINITHWWMGNLLGILLVTPVVLTWRTLPRAPQNKPLFILEFLALIVLTFICGQVLFMGWMHNIFDKTSNSYWMFIFICWSALRFGLHGTLLIVSMIAIQSVIAISAGLGVFGQSTYIVNTWFYLLTLLLVGTTLSTIMQKRRQSDDALVENEIRWKYALEGAGDGVWDWNIQNNEVVFSKNWKTMLGYEEHEINNHLAEWSDRVHPDDKENVFADVQAYLKGEKPSYINEHRMRCKDNSWKWIMDRGMVFSHTKDNQPLRMVGTHTDISRHKQLEYALKQSEDDLNTIFAQSPDGIVVFDDEHKLSHVNQAFCKLSGLQASQLFNRTESDFDQLMQGLCRKSTSYPATAHLVNQEIAGAQFKLPASTQPQRRASDRTGEIEIFTPDHRILSRSVIELDHKRLSRVMYFHDITAEAMVDRMKSDFLSTAAHELRTPMSIILGYAELLKAQAFDRDTEEHMLDSIHNQSLSIVALLNELLDLARIEARAGKAFVMEKTALRPIIQSVAETFMLPGDTRKVILEAAPTLPEIMMDREKIAQALKNCLSNAFKFSPPNTDVIMKVKKQNNGLHPEISISVQDKGIGMDSEQQSHVFEKFYRADFSGSIPGTGLGMTLIKEIIEHHGGRVELKSAVNKGTTITLILPVLPE